MKYILLLICVLSTLHCHACQGADYERRRVLTEIYYMVEYQYTVLEELYTVPPPEQWYYERGKLSGYLDIYNVIMNTEMH
jgi:hypothetical protein